ncbi:ornithine cyclodeaminase [Gluconacetobacter liquefaciens]|uniref:1-piperideine-2-carboxylate/1-pyrroline-2-carboxylate reductase [NAD(P)H] n=1 Tax=Gluconacetobacter liquefaciens TaxID=89584 RepID=A0A370G7M3_GLULI|nr:delta(1)-pyrroline-2-carboxylate reductase family protein [Gluconacetobacter liquefaciens]MBB2185984.1 delta(1)-pyrroline-2-carboxylate reductase family protein [Gluconacetobacter liquefaciens]RDI39802.1 1-piperideine-2-carboxylate/1-pyrroline-2-carboxylate reductase [NAD(P)H] [Gluconacetobacter liquefaciens]GEB37603.1 ornithine cyclodeaminase [Gluconacetobacter liquefaciens]
MQIFTAGQTASLLPFPELVDTLQDVVRDYAAGSILSPERMVVDTADAGGHLLCMPSVANDIMATKLITIFHGNKALPVIQGQVTCCDARDGTFLFTLDGPETTGRRTAAMSMLAIRMLHHSPPRHVLIIGTGTQARGHVNALRTLHPEAVISVRGRRPAGVTALCATLDPTGHYVRPETPGDAEAADIVITTTSSRDIVYDAAPRAGRLVIGVGAYRPEMIEIGPNLVLNSRLFVDDPIGAPSEAGDLIQAGVDWQNVFPLATAIDTPPPPEIPVLFKSVGCAAWDLAACRLARRRLTEQGAAAAP